MYVHKYGHCILAYRFLEEILGLFGEDVLLRGIFPILEDYVSDFQFLSISENIPSLVE